MATEGNNSQIWRPNMPGCPAGHIEYRKVSSGSEDSETQRKPNKKPRQSKTSPSVHTDLLGLGDDMGQCLQNFDQYKKNGDGDLDIDDGDASNATSISDEVIQSAVGQSIQGYKLKPAVTQVSNLILEAPPSSFGHRRTVFLGQRDQSCSFTTQDRCRQPIGEDG